MIMMIYFLILLVMMVMMMLMTIDTPQSTTGLVQRPDLGDVCPGLANLFVFFFPLKAICSQFSISQPHRLCLSILAQVNRIVVRKSPK